MIDRLFIGYNESVPPDPLERVLLLQISDKCDPDELIELIETINPTNTPGKIMIIVRMGAEKLRQNLPVDPRAVRGASWGHQAGCGAIARPLVFH
eukprot:876334-Prorocentrum_minimum.AAC.9